jgi:hypothetical protein
MDIIIHPFYWLILGVIPTVLLGTVFGGIFGMAEEQRHMGVKVAGVSIVIGAVIDQFFL